ncbi:MAG: hypothetical protein IJV01_04710 [Bacteroidales bacterium]|nr:hypothetical protein [Bacteroidales bacterium]
MRRFGLIGYPLQGSLSPRLFSAAYAGAWPYEFIETPDFEQAWARFEAEYEAVNVTAPFKENAFRRVAQLEEAGRGWLSDAVRVIGATNLLVKTGRGVEAHNSDYLGVRAVLSGAGFGPGSRAVVAGWGGAAKAVAAAARDLGMQVIVCNRTLREPFLRPLSELPRLAAESDLLVYTLPEAIAETERLACPAILEANYKCPCLCGHAPLYLSGRDWILAQAVAGYALMTGAEPDGEALRRAAGMV